MGHVHAPSLRGASLSAIPAKGGRVSQCRNGPDLAGRFMAWACSRDPLDIRDWAVCPRVDQIGRQEQLAGGR
jgi:hypothetical protein